MFHECLCWINQRFTYMVILYVAICEYLWGGVSNTWIRFVVLNGLTRLWSCALAFFFFNRKLPKRQTCLILSSLCSTLSYDSCAAKRVLSYAPPITLTCWHTCPHLHYDGSVALCLNHQLFISGNLERWDDELKKKHWTDYYHPWSRATQLYTAQGPLSKVPKVEGLWAITMIL